MTQVSKRLDERFTWEVKDRLLQTLREFTAAIELRLAAGDAKDTAVDVVIAEIQDLALTRINDILLPGAQRIQALTSLGFLIATSSTNISLAVGPKTFIVDAGDQRDLFTPSPFVSVEAAGDLSVRGVGQVLLWDKASGTLALQMLAADGSTAFRTDWVLSASAGVTEAVRQDMGKAQAAAAAARADRLLADADVLSTAADRAAADISASSASASATAAAASAASVDPAQILAQAEDNAIAITLALS